MTISKSLTGAAIAASLTLSSAVYAGEAKAPLMDPEQLVLSTQTGGENIIVPLLLFVLFVAAISANSEPLVRG